MSTTQKDRNILQFLAARRSNGCKAPTCRLISEAAGKSYAQWAMKALRRLEQRGFVAKSRPDSFNNIYWKITDAGLERLALDTGDNNYRLLFEQTPSGALSP
jgi:repressor of nif and glnA expression